MYKQLYSGQINMCATPIIKNNKKVKAYLFTKTKYKHSILSAQCAAIISIISLLTGYKYHPQENTAVIAKYSNHDDITVTISQSPKIFTLTNDLFITINVQTTNGTEIKLPKLIFSGFKLISEFDSLPELHNSKLLYKRHIRLHPLIATEYAINSFAISYKNRTHYPATEKNFIIPKAKLTPHIKNTLPQQNIINTFIPASEETSKHITPLVVAAIICIILSLYFIRKNKAYKVMSISPKETALNKLDYLLSEKMIEKEQFRQFYFALSDIIRHYIEDTIPVTSSQQTSNELIAAAQSIENINPDILQELKILLQHCDLVKFSEKVPTPDEISEDIKLTRNILDSNIIMESEEINEL